MKKLLFGAYSLDIGGIEKALVNLLNRIDYKKYSVDVIVEEKKGIFLPKITSKANIIEVKHQQVNGSVDEKLQTCDFKKKQYIKLFSELNYKVEFMYILDEWFRKPQYKDTRDYIISVGCHYYYNYIPLQELGLPVPQSL